MNSRIDEDVNQQSIPNVWFVYVQVPGLHHYEKFSTSRRFRRIWKWNRTLLDYFSKNRVVYNTVKYEKHAV